MKVVMTTMLELIEEVRAMFPQVTFEAATDVTEQKIQVRDADACIGWPAQEVFLAAERLRWVHTPGTGIDQLPWLVPALTDSDVVLTNTRGHHSESMGDHVFGMILNLARPFTLLRDDQRRHRWSGGQSGKTVDLSSKNIGILAMGDAGMAVARRAHGFGMNVYGVDKHPKTQAEKPREVRELWKLDRLDDMLRLSDWFVVTAPLTSETRGMIDRRRLGLLKRGAYVIVVSRAHIIDEDALIDGLHSGHIAGAGLDVTSQELLPKDNPLWDMDNVILTPHCSASSPARYKGARQVFKENLRRFVTGEPLMNICDKRAGF